MWVVDKHEAWCWDDRMIKTEGMEGQCACCHASAYWEEDKRREEENDSSL
jgi:hypothetical protein